MQAHTKKHPIKKVNKIYPQLYFSFENHSYTLQNVPHAEIQPVIEQLKKILKHHKIQEQKVSQSEDWRSVFANTLKNVGGEAAYREAALVIRVSRREAGMSQKQLAELLETEQAYVSKMETARIPVGKKTAQKLSKIFNKGYKVFLTDMPAEK